MTGLDLGLRAQGYLPIGRWISYPSLQSDPHYVKESFKTGVTGYLLKECAFEEWVEAVHAVAAGGTYASSEIEVSVP